eukprot:2070151-Pleurochrysis_carterae.AAC.2
MQGLLFFCIPYFAQLKQSRSQRLVMLRAFLEKLLPPTFKPNGNELHTIHLRNGLACENAIKHARLQKHKRTRGSVR